MNKLHIIEPTLRDQAGHCYSHVSSLLEAKQKHNLNPEVWLAHGGANLFDSSKSIVHPYFWQKIRKLQKFFCYKKLLKDEGYILITTAGRIDLVVMDKCIKKSNFNKPIFFYFHQFKVTPKKIEILKDIAKRRSNFIIMAATQRLLTIFQECGFIHCEWVPCPSFEPQYNITQTIYAIPKIIYAGAARADKGFAKVVDFVEYATKNKLPLTFSIQISPPASNKYDEITKASLAQLRELKNENLILNQRTLKRNEYQSLFNGSICLLLYNMQDYRDKFSGVTLDAFYAGCPIVTVANTWMGDTVQRFNAGVVVKDQTPETVYAAVNKIQQNYSQFVANCHSASKMLAKEHDPSYTWAVINKHIDSDNPKS